MSPLNWHRNKKTNTFETRFWTVQLHVCEGAVVLKAALTIISCVSGEGTLDGDPAHRLCFLGKKNNLD